MSLKCIDLYETDGLLLFRSKSIIFQTLDLEQVIEKAENIFNFYLDFNWEFGFIGRNKLRQHRIFCRSFIEISWEMRKLRSTNRDSINRTIFCRYFIVFQELCCLMGVDSIDNG